MTSDSGCRAVAGRGIESSSSSVCSGSIRRETVPLQELSSLQAALHVSVQVGEHAAESLHVAGLTSHHVAASLHVAVQTTTLDP